MKKLILPLLAALSLSSCATILAKGPITDYQKTKPAAGQPQREIRAGYLIADICFGLIPVAVDFGTGAVYRPEPKKK